MNRSAYIASVDEPIRVARILELTPGSFMEAGHNDWWYLRPVAVYSRTWFDWVTIAKLILQEDSNRREK